jgi:hypothetical protein
VLNKLKPVNQWKQEAIERYYPQDLIASPAAAAAAAEAAAAAAEAAAETDAKLHMPLN